MSEADLTAVILREIRDEIKATRGELKAELAATRTELGGRIDETNRRLGVVEDTLKDLAGQQLLLTRYVKNIADRHDTAIDELRERVTRLETKVG